MNDYMKTKKRVLTRRGVLWLGQTCNLHCHFCYFLDRIKSARHPEHPFMSLDKAKQICRTLVDVYGNRAIDIQGGEPTIHPHIHELVRYCRDIGLVPTLITNSLVLSNRDACLKLKNAGVRDLLVSVHGLGETFDEIVGVKGAHLKQMAALENLVSVGIPFRFNCVLSKLALPQLVDIARLAVDKGARAVNFIAFNPFEDQQKLGMRSTENVPRYSDVSAMLEKALDLLAHADMEANVRYFPFCMLKERHWQSNYNFQQLSYDVHEWDYASWSWTGMRPQRMRDGEPSPTVSLEQATCRAFRYPGPLQSLAVKVHDMLAPFPRLTAIGESFNRRLSSLLQKGTPAKQPGSDIREQLYRDNARLRAAEHCKYVYSAKCTHCSLKGICDGFHGDYAELFGTDESRTVRLDTDINDPKQFILMQSKVVEREDYNWAI